MAKGRFISRSVGHSREIARLPDDTTRMIFAFILPNLDVEGRIDADPIYLTGVCLSRLQIPAQKVARALVAMYEVGLIELYEEEGLPYLEYVNFQKHQEGLRKEREPESLFPAPSGNFPTEFEPYLKSPLYKPEPKPDIHVGDDAAADCGNVAAECGILPQTPEGTSEAPPQNDGISLSLSVSRSPKELESSLGKDRGDAPPTPALPEPPNQASPPEPKKTPPPPPSEDRLKNFSLIKTKLGPRKKLSPEDEDIDLITECLAEDSNRDLWFNLPHSRVQEAIRESTIKFRGGGYFRTELIAELDKATRTLRASVSPASGTFDGLVQEWERETGDKYQN